MRKKHGVRLLLVVTLAAAAGAGTTQAPDDVVSRAMHDELARSMTALRLDTFPGPYFVEYRVDEVQILEAAGVLGSLVQTDVSRHRRADVEVRVGDYAFDNTNFFSMPGAHLGSRLEQATHRGQLPLDDDYRELRRQLWLDTDASYKTAIEQLAQKRAMLRGRAPREYVPDLSREDPATTTEFVSWTPPDRGRAEDLVRRLSGLFRNHPELERAGVGVDAGVLRTWYLNSEGTKLLRVSPWTTLHVWANTQATDGTSLSDEAKWFRSTLSDLPDADVLADSVRALARRLVALRAAPKAEVYHGPVLFEAAASVELFSQVVAPLLGAIRRPLSDNPMFESGFGRFDQSPFLERIGARVLPRFLSVTDEPRLRTFEGQPVAYRQADDEGVPTRTVKLIEGGVLKTLLTTRVPVAALRRSTGSRRGHGPQVTTLVVTVDSGLTADAMRRELLKVAAARGLPYGLVVRRVVSPEGAMLDNPFAFFSQFGDGEPGAGFLAAAFRLYPDGREEPIRNVVIGDVTPAALREIVAASRDRVARTMALPGERPFFGGSGNFNVVLGKEAASFVVPAVILEEVTVRPPSGEAPRLPLTRP